MEVDKDTFEERLERRMKSWEQEQHEKKVFGHPADEIEWRIVKIGYGYIRRPFVKKKDA